MAERIHLAFLGCGFITGVHSRALKSLRSDFVCSYASRDAARAEAYRRRFGGARSYGGYRAAFDDPEVDAVVVAVPPRDHRELTLAALAAGKHVLVEKPAFPHTDDFHAAIAARDRAGRVVIVGENDHYKPLAVRLRQLLAEQVVGEVVFAHFATIARRLKRADDWRNDEAIAGGDAFFEEGIHWLHVAGSLGPRIVGAHGLRPRPSPAVGPDRRVKSMLVTLRYDNGSVGTLFYSREIPSLLRGLRVSKIYGRRGVITFESNGVVMLVRGERTRLIQPGLRDIRGYRAMHRDFARAIREATTPEMSLERALDDHYLMEQIYSNLDTIPRAAASGEPGLR